MPDWQQQAGMVKPVPGHSMTFRAASFSALALLTASPAIAQDDPFAGIPNLTLTYYDVAGRTVEGIGRDIRLQGLTDARDGKSVDARANWWMDWRWDNRGEGEACRPVNVAVGFRADITLPRLTDASHLPSYDRAKWDTYIKALRQHEANHVRYALDRTGEVAEAIRASRCDLADGTAKAVTSRIREHDAEYDRVTQHGVTEGAVFP
jgi:predicted secreted Zn-dependent protease